jgi:hypothetical protein
MTTQRPKTLSIREFSKTVDAAVKQAAEKHGVKFEAGLVMDWTIFGRILRELEETKVATANQVAADLASSISSAHAELARGAGGTPEPVVFGRRGILICGFIPVDPIEFRE